MVKSVSWLKSRLQKSCYIDLITIELLLLNVYFHECFKVECPLFWRWSKTATTEVLKLAWQALVFENTFFRSFFGLLERLSGKGALSCLLPLNKAVRILYDFSEKRYSLWIAKERGKPNECVNCLLIRYWCKLSRQIRQSKSKQINRTLSTDVFWSVREAFKSVGIIYRPKPKQRWEKPKSLLKKEFRLLWWLTLLKS